MNNLVEPTFEIAYLAAGLFISIFVLFKSKKRIPYLLLASMGLTLFICDAMVIIPKMVDAWSFQLNDIYAQVGVSRSAIAITMTVLFVVIYFFYRKIKAKEVNPLMDWIVSILGASRILMSLIPISDIHLAHHYSDNFISNIPFVALAFIVAFYSYKWTKNDIDYLFENIELAFIVALSFFATYHLVNTNNSFVISLFPILIGIISISLIKFRFIRKRE